MSLVSSDWLEKNLNDVKIIDCSWHMPGVNRNPHDEYLNELFFNMHGTLFFTMDNQDDRSYLLEDENDFSSDIFYIYFLLSIVKGCQVFSSFVLLVSTTRATSGTSTPPKILWIVG